MEQTFFLCLLPPDRIFLGRSIIVCTLRWFSAPSGSDEVVRNYRLLWNEKQNLESRTRQLESRIWNLDSEISQTNFYSKSTQHASQQQPRAKFDITVVLLVPLILFQTLNQLLSSIGKGTTKITIASTTRIMNPPGNDRSTVGGGTAATTGTGIAGVPTMRGGVEYRCGDCGAKNVIKGGDAVRCRQCGFRILYKTRTKRCTYNKMEGG
jgi:DNA-directed RNA polymerase I, II, and III subunit RPABC4